MPRRKRGEKIDGWLILDKPVGPSSTQALGRVKSLIKPHKAGHGGTLDPLASGVLPIAFGEATKVINAAVDGTKRYRFTIRWGITTSTDDCEGETVAESPVRPSLPAIERVLDRFVGEITQIPPAYSAIKIDGERAYARARAGEAVDIPTRRVQIDTLACLDARKDEADFDVTCGKGTYVRALARDLALALDTVGHVTALRRTRVAHFDETAAISLEMLEKLDYGARVRMLLPLETVLDDIPALAVTAEEAQRLRQGQKLTLATSLAGPVLVTSHGIPVAMATVADGETKPERVFNL